MLYNVMRISEWRFPEYCLVAEYISDVMLNSHIKGKEFDREEHVQYIAISTDKTTCCQMFQLLHEQYTRGLSCSYELSFWHI